MASYTGNNNANTFAGTSENDVIDGMAGPDTLSGGDGDDVIKGGLGSDNLSGGIGDDSVYGGDGYDTILGGANNDVIDGGADNDSLLGGSGEDSITGGAGNDFINGEDGNDRIYITTFDGMDKVDGGLGTDTLVISDSAATSNNYYNFYSLSSPTIIAGGTTIKNIEQIDLTSGSGNDTVYGYINNDTLAGSSGNDYIYGNAGDDRIHGGDGDDFLQGNEGNDTLLGGAGNDKLSLELMAGVDILDGGDGVDTLSFSIVNTTGINLEFDFTGISTAAGASLKDGTLLRNIENISVYGARGNDRIVADGGDDTLYGGEAGQDTLVGGAGNDTFLKYNLYGGEFDGGEGVEDLISYGLTSYSASLRYDFTKSNTVAGSYLLDGSVVRNIEHVYFASGSGADWVKGTSGADTILGGDGDDTIGGGEGADSIDGGAGNDTVIFDGKADDYVVSNGADGKTFVSNSVTGHVDVLLSVEVIKFYDPLDHELLVGSNEADTLIATSDKPWLMYGYSGNDSLSGNSGSDTLYGGDGNDELSGGIGSDLIFGENGDDVIYSLSQDGPDTIDGGAGYDVAILDRRYTYSNKSINLAGNSILVPDGTELKNIEAFNYTGSSGNETIIGSSGNDTIAGFDGEDVVFGMDGDDVIITSGTAASVFYGGVGRDTIIATSRASIQLPDFEYGPDGDYLRTTQLTFQHSADGQWDYGQRPGPGASRPLLGYYDVYYPRNDAAYYSFVPVVGLSERLATEENLEGYRPAYSHVGTQTSEVWIGTDAFERVNMFAGDDSLNAGGGDDTLQGGSGNDTLDGGDGSDVLWGYEDEDLLNGGAGIDDLFGNRGNDTLYGGDGDDRLDGGAGDDRLEGQLGNDLLKGGEGNDFLSGLEGQDTMQGGAGDDQLYSFFRQGPDVIDGGADTDFAFISRTEQTIDLALNLSLTGTQNLGDGTQVTSIEQLTYRGGSGADNITGGTLADDLAGNAGNDILAGGAGNDTLDGGAGSDTIVFSGLKSEYSVANRTGGGYLVQDLRTGSPDGTDTVLNAEVLRFSDTTQNLTAVNSAPGAISDSNAAANQVAENSATGTLVGMTALASDPNAGDSLTYSLVNSAGGRFAINAATGVVSVANGMLLDYETATSHVVRVRATDTGGLFSEADVTINLTDVVETSPNWAPGAISDSNASANQVAENAASGTLVGVTAFASDPDAGDSLTYSLINNAGGRFAINASTGVVTVVNGSLLDYETATGHLIRVRATDTGGLFSEADFTVNLTDVAEGGTSFTGTAGADTFTATSVANWTLSGLDGNDSLTGAGGNDTLDGGLGNDTLTGGVGNDTFLVRGTEASADSLLGGEGTTDTLKVEGTTILTLAGFDTLVNGIEVWAGNNKGVIGTGAANRFDLSGLTSITGLPSLDAGGGNDTVIGSGSADNLQGGAGTDSLVGGAGSDTLTGGAGNDTLDGGAGSDTIVFSGLLSNYSVANRTGGGYLVQDLRTGSPDGTDTVLNAEVLRFSDASVTLAASNSTPTDIALSGAQVSENAAAGTLIGTLTGTDPDAGDKLTFALTAPSSLFAVSGTALVVASGAVIDYEAAQSQSVLIKVTDAAGASYTESFSISLTNQFVTTMGTSAADVLTAPTPGEEARISGLDGNDTLTGAAGNDTLDGGNGADSLVGGAGADQIIGGAGSDTAGYESASSGIGLDMADAAWAGAYGDARGDVLTGIERVNGSAYADVIRGTSAADVLSGNAGNDSLIGRDGADTLTGGDGNDTIEGGAGADNLNGQAGTDLISYASATGGITLDLANLAGRTGEAALDTIQAGFEGIIGTAFADALSGTTGSNVLEGGAGNDRLSGKAGADTFVFRSGSGSDLITDFTAGTGVNDVIEWHGQFTSFAQVQAAASDFTGTVQGSAFTGVQIQAGTDVLYLAGITKAALMADDFAYL